MVNQHIVWSNLDKIYIINELHAFSWLDIFSNKIIINRPFMLHTNFTFINKMDQPPVDNELKSTLIEGRLLHVHIEPRGLCAQ